VADFLDIEQPAALETYLRATQRVDATEAIHSRSLSGGVSNRTVLVRRASGEAWVVKQALPKLRVAVDWFSDPRRIEREAAAMRRLRELSPPGTITRLIFEDRERHLLAMEAVPEPHQNWKELLLAGQVDMDRVGQFAELLATIHGQAWRRGAELAPEFADRRFFESLRLEPYYAFTAAQVPAAAAFLNRLIAETRPVRDTLVHGDFSPKNILIAGPRMVLLDHEVVHWGDAAFDLGFSLAHLLSKAHHLPAHRDALARAAGRHWQTYRQTLGGVPWLDGLEGRAVRHTLSCLLARVAGRSPLEYLDPRQRDAQREAIVPLMQDLPSSIDALTDAFLARL
jgi:aminoglycoside phosphotransferase (APT) family kinase protein